MLLLSESSFSSAPKTLLQASPVVCKKHADSSANTCDNETKLLTYSVAVFSKFLLISQHLPDKLQVTAAPSLQLSATQPVKTVI